LNNFTCREVKIDMNLYEKSDNGFVFNRNQSLCAITLLPISNRLDKLSLSRIQIAEALRALTDNYNYRWGRCGKWGYDTMLSFRHYHERIKCWNKIYTIGKIIKKCNLLFYPTLPDEVVSVFSDSIVRQRNAWSGTNMYPTPLFFSELYWTSLSKRIPRLGWWS
jgi:hypothetical protein